MVLMFFIIFIGQTAKKQISISLIKNFADDYDYHKPLLFSCQTKESLQTTLDT
jgi:hypothetical protein